MSVEYLEPRVEVDAETRSLGISLVLKNHSDDPWRTGEGFYLGWQLFDPDTGTFLSEGGWIPLAGDIPPGDTETFSFSVALPPERGRYRVYVSPIDQKTGWHYRKGGSLLAVDAVVDQRRLELLRSRVTTLRGLRRENFGRSLRKALVHPASTIWQNRNLIRSMVRRDIQGRYRGSFGDIVWTVLNPLLLMATYFFVFGIVLQARFGADPSRAGFALYFLAGMLPWLPFAESAGRAPHVILEYRNFVKKLVFPVEILPVNQVFAGLVTGGFALAVFCAALLLARGAVPLSIVWLPALLIPQILFTLGVCWFLAALGAYMRDLGQIMGFLLTLWFFLTPICYPEASLPAEAIPILEKNPMYAFVRGYRAILLEGTAPAFGSIWKLWLLSIIVCLLGHAWFYKLRKSFADIL